MIGSGKVIRVGGFNLSTLCSSLLGNRQGGLTPILKTLFANGEQGFAYDPNDLSSLFQDSTGNTPVTAAGQPVGLVLDKSKSFKMGSELFTQFNSTLNSTLSQNTLPCVVTSTVSIGVFGVAAANIFQEGLYKIEFTWSGNASQADMGVQLPNGNNLSLGTGVTGSFSKVMNFTSTGSFSITKSAPQVGQTFTVSAVSVKKIAGNHASQAVSSCRPLLGRHPITGVRNLIKYSEDSTKWVGASFGTGTHPVVAYGVQAPDGTMTASSVYLDKGASSTNEDQSTLYPSAASSLGTVIGRAYTASFWLRTSDGTTKTVRADFNGVTADSGTSSQLTVTPTWTKFVVKLSSAIDNQRAIAIRLRASSTDNTAALHVWNVQQEEGLTATAYQKTNGNHDVTEAGVTNANNLYFDGIDDFLVTNNIDFTATDKVTVFTGIRKLSDTATAVVAELGADTITVNGTFGLFAPAGTGVTKFQFLSRGATGTNYAQALNAIYNAPISAVVRGIGSIADQKSELHVNGGLAGKSPSGLVGAGNYNNYPLYIGRRGGVSLPFNGSIYGLIGVGRLTSETEVLAIEQILAKRTGVTLSV